MKKIFITYADNNFKKSARRIKSEAVKLNLFDDFIIYKPEKLPSAVRNHPVFAFKKGGGYWLWKAYIIYNTLEKMNWNDILCYSDAGSVLFKSDEWFKYMQILESKDAVFFQYKDENYNWGHPRLKDWIKKSTFLYFKDISNSDDWCNQPKFLAGLMLLKKTPKTVEFIDDWFKIMTLLPNLLVDEFGVEKEKGDYSFYAHRHDQSILSSMLLTYKNLNFEYIPEDSENKRIGQAVFAARIKDKEKEPLAKILRRYLKKIIGKNLYEKIKQLVNATLNHNN